MKTKTFLLMVVFLGFYHSVSAQALDITVKNIKSNTKGVIRIAFFSSEDDFKKEKILFELVCEKDKVKDGELKVKTPVQSGRYGLAVLDDINNTGKMEYKLLAIPKKGFGFSNYKLKGFFKPKFNDFAFDINKNEIKEITVSMRYF